MDVSETGFCLRIQVEPTQLRPVDRASFCLRTKSSLRNVVFGIKDRTMDNVQNCDININVTSSQIYR
jgi:hypothetical protein